MWRRLIAVSTLIFVVANISRSPISAQQPTIISLGVPGDLQSLFSTSVIDTFQAAHPNIQLQVIPLSIKFSNPVSDIQGYLDNFKTLASSADVVLVDSQFFAPEATRAKNFLNLKPYTDTDSFLNPADFFPAIWQSFQWDGAVWAIPFSANVGVLTYDPVAFDQAGLSYPMPNWTLDDLAHAAQTLTQKAADGSTIPGLDTSDTYLQGALFRSLLSDNLFDPNSVPNQPQFDRPDVAKLLSTWSDLVKGGAVATGASNASMNVSDPQVLINDSKLAGTLLPGGHAALETLGLAISAGTLYSDQAYTVASYFATIPGMTVGATDIPAHKNLFTQSNPNDRVQTLIRQAIDNALPASDIRYTNYLSIGLNKIVTDNLDPQVASQAALVALNQNLQTAESTANPQALTVPTPIPTITGGSITFFANFLRSGYNYDPALWKQLADDFTNHDPEIKQINFMGRPSDDNNTLGDCGLIYGWDNKYDDTPDAWVNPVLLDLKPLMAADPDFNAGSYIGDSLRRMQFGDHIYGLPVALMPAYLKYDPAQFLQAGVPEPTNDWTISDFIDALKQLKDKSPIPPFEQSYTRVGPQPGALHLFMLMAALGSAPIDYSSEPVTVKNDTVTLDAVQQLLDLAKNGYIKYYKNSLGYLDQSLWYSLIKTTDRPAITTEVLTPYVTRKILGTPDQPSQYRPVFYPQGTHTRPMGYTAIDGFIDAKSPHPDGCYRWIKYIEAHPALIQAMPANRTELDNPMLAAAHGSQMVAFYKQIDQALQSPDAVIFPESFGTDPDIYTDYWVGQAFNAYVLQGQDVKIGLDQAQSYMQTFMAQCKNKIPMMVGQPANWSEIIVQEDRYYASLKHCAWQIDPTLRKFG